MPWFPFIRKFLDRFLPSFIFSILGQIFCIQRLEKFSLFYFEKVCWVSLLFLFTEKKSPMIFLWESFILTFLWYKNIKCQTFKGKLPKFEKKQNILQKTRISMRKHSFIWKKNTFTYKLNLILKNKKSYPKQSHMLKLILLVQKRTTRFWGTPL